MNEYNLVDDSMYKCRMGGVEQYNSLIEQIVWRELCEYKQKPKPTLLLGRDGKNKFNTGLIFTW